MAFNKIFQTLDTSKQLFHQAVFHNNPIYGHQLLLIVINTYKYGLSASSVLFIASSTSL